MKKSAIFAMSVLALGFTACSGGGNNNAETPVKAATTVKTDSLTLPNIRYIDGDSVSSQYNLAKDFKEASIRAFSKVDNARAAKAAEIQKFGNAIDQKLRSNGYLSEDAYKADLNKLNKMQQDAATYLDNLLRTTDPELAQQQIQLSDSVEAFIKEYNAKKGYDAILFKAAGVYFNPALDITQEVVDGLNARYNKVATK